MKLVPKDEAAWRQTTVFCLACFAFLFHAAVLLLAGTNREPNQEVILFILGVSSASALMLIVTGVVIFRQDANLAKLTLFLGVTAVLSAWLVAPGLSHAREKPVIYLYPETTTQVRVTLDYNGKFMVTDPPYGDAGWLVEARPDGALTDLATGRAYPYLFWEGRDRDRYGIEQGFVIAGAEAGGFLREKLAAMGLAEREIDDFVEYWEPRLEANPYNLVSFPNDAYAKNVGLKVSPAPDTVIRVFMVFRAINKPVEIEPQTFEASNRVGFTVVEWGGSEM
jgi:hypothetical protein